MTLHPTLAQAAGPVAAYAVGAVLLMGAPAPARPQVTLACDMEMCIVEAAYVLPARDDDHRLTVRWATSGDRSYRENRADALLREVAGRPDGPARGIPGGYRYSATDVVWHSDIRCDDTVSVTVAGEQVTAVTRTARKDVPARTGDAYCSDQGMPGELSAR